MSNNELFNSKTDPIPEVRRNIDIIPVENNGHSYLYFHDSLGYATPDFALDRQVASLLSLLDGGKSIRDLSPYLGENVTEDHLLQYIRFLDENRVLHSAHFKEQAEKVEREYEKSDVHEAVTAGFSYPAEPDKLKSYLDQAFSGVTSKHEASDPKTIKALFAPHIDPRVGIESYTGAFSAIKDINPKRVVILGTSHYAGLYSDTYKNDPFIISKKDFKMPLGTIPSDREAIDRLLSESAGSGITEQDRAHRIEHSIELHLLFLSYLWNHPFKVVPILVSGLDDLMYMRDGFRAKQIEEFGEVINKLFGKDEDTFFLISGDLAHVGKKFGDRKPARELFDEVKGFDKLFLKYAGQASEERLLDLVSDRYDPYRICGFPPLYTFLKSIAGIKGEVLNYDLWDEHERESAVSFGSIIYWNTD